MTSAGIYEYTTMKKGNDKVMENNEKEQEHNNGHNDTYNDDQDHHNMAMAEAQDVTRCDTSRLRFVFFLKFYILYY